MKQSKLRRRRVIRFAVLYFALLIVFLGLMIAPAVLSSTGMLVADNIIGKVAGSVAGFILLQPVSLTSDDSRGSTQTGTAIKGGATKTSSTSTRRNNNRASPTGNVNEEPWRFLM